ncbi:MAG TPA: YidC/Oxa1 family membrane protein insertase [Anaerolineae bacterium]|nr:YidC/Oxa1 family membrane protein insertase [Anaerolineae bacterium]
MWDALVVTPLTQGLIFLNDLIQGMGAPYSWGFAIILFTLIVKIVTLPLNLQQARSMKATQELQPKLQELQKKYAKDKEKLAQAQMELYREHGVNPLGGCLPMLIQLPILFGLYQALYKLASTGEIVGQRFLWIPDLAFPTRGMGIKWVWPPAPEFIGWATAALYLILPVLTVVTQIVMQRMTTPPTASRDPQQAAMQQTMLIMPFMFGFITLQVPAGLTLYWVTSNIFSMIQQYFITGWGSLLPRKKDEKVAKVVKREAGTSGVEEPTGRKGRKDGKGKRRKKKR